MDSENTEATLTSAQKHVIATTKYDKRHTRQFTIKLNYRTDADIVTRLAQEENRQGYVKSCIRTAMRFEKEASQEND